MVIKRNPIGDRGKPWSTLMQLRGNSIYCEDAASNPNLSLSEERSARAEGERRERCNAGRRIHTGFSFCSNSESGADVRRPRYSTPRLDESARVRCVALHLTRRHRCAAFADLSSDKERLGIRTMRAALSLQLAGTSGDGLARGPA